MGGYCVVNSVGLSYGGTMKALFQSDTTYSCVADVDESVDMQSQEVFQKAMLRISFYYSNQNTNTTPTSSH